MCLIFYFPSFLQHFDFIRRRWMQSARICVSGIREILSNNLQTPALYPLRFGLCVVPPLQYPRTKLKPLSVLQHIRIIALFVYICNTIYKMGIRGRLGPFFFHLSPLLVQKPVSRRTSEKNEPLQSVFSFKHCFLFVSSCRFAVKKFLLSRVRKRCRWWARQHSHTDRVESKNTEKQGEKNEWRRVNLCKHYYVVSSGMTVDQGAIKLLLYSVILPNILQSCLWKLLHLWCVHLNYSRRSWLTFVI